MSAGLLTNKPSISSRRGREVERGEDMACRVPLRKRGSLAGNVLRTVTKPQGSTFSVSILQENTAQL